MNKCVLPKPRYVPFHAYPITDTYTLHNGIVTWHFSICLSLISIGLLALGLLLSAQLCCARPWSFERKFLIMFHSFLMVDYIAVIVFLVVWLSSNSSPSRFDFTRAGPSASGLTIASILMTSLAAIFCLFTLVHISCYLEQRSQGFIPKINAKQMSQDQLIGTVQLIQQRHHRSSQEQRPSSRSKRATSSSRTTQKKHNSVHFGVNRHADYV